MRISVTDLDIVIKNINSIILNDYGVELGGELSGAYGGVKFEIGSGADLSNGFIPKKELYWQLQTLKNALHEISRLQRKK